MSFREIISGPVGSFKERLFPILPFGCTSTVFVDYHRLRPHQAKDNDLLFASKRRPKKPTRASKPADALPLSEIRCEQRLGGLLKHYYRKAA